MSATSPVPTSFRYYACYVTRDESDYNRYCTIVQAEYELEFKKKKLKPWPILSGFYDIPAAGTMIGLYLVLRSQHENAMVDALHANGSCDLRLWFADSAIARTSSTAQATWRVPYLNWLRYVLDQTSIPRTICTSTISSKEYDFPPGYGGEVVRPVRAASRLGPRASASSSRTVIRVSPAMGVLVRGSSRDITWFLPQFPASYTSMGHQPERWRYDLEVAPSLSGGGFSNYFLRPPPCKANAVPFQNIGNMHKHLFEFVHCRYLT